MYAFLYGKQVRGHAYVPVAFYVELKRLYYAKLWQDATVRESGFKFNYKTYHLQRDTLELDTAFVIARAVRVSRVQSSVPSVASVWHSPLLGLISTWSITTRERHIPFTVSTYTLQW